VTHSTGHYPAGKESSGSASLPSSSRTPVGVGISAGGKSAELGQVAFFGGKFDELVRCIPAAGCGQAAQLVEVPSLGRAFDKFRDGVEVPAGGLVT
jgi:hypothetical protein